MTPREVDGNSNPHFMEELPAEDAINVTEALKYDERFEDAKSGYKSITPFRQLIFLYKLFFSSKFLVHRVGGLAFLLMYAWSFYTYFTDYEAFKNSFVIWALPALGVFQSVNAIYTFTFLPKAKKDGGYFGDKSILSYPFIIENSFYAMILFYQWIYYDDTFFKYISGSVLIEQIFVFFPYVIRQKWPKRRSNRTEKNHLFFTIATYVTKAFYIWAKHYIGYFLNYARFLNRITESETYYIHHILVFSSFATTIAVFLQTLKFKRYIGPRTSFIVYFISYMGTFYGFIKHWPFKLPVQIGYQVAMCLLMNAARMGLDFGSVAGMPVLYFGQYPAMAATAST
ncbi:hypothetical protein BC829DRAFT_386732 [Chytridium lagenaria]|nr:hypothetical protein BC829DRAFT_386732 [Chytridium lagenaria]